MKLTIVVYRAIIVYLSGNYQKLIDSGEEIGEKSEKYSSFHFTTIVFNKIPKKDTG